MRYGLIYEKTIFEKLEMTYSVDMVRYDFAFDKTACESMSHDMQKLYDYLSDNIRADPLKPPEPLVIKICSRSHLIMMIETAV